MHVTSFVVAPPLTRSLAHFVVFLLMLLSAVLLTSCGSSELTDAKVDELLRNRLAVLDDEAKLYMSEEGFRSGADMADVQQAYELYMAADGRFRNEYLLANGFEKITARKNVEVKLGIPLDTTNVLSAYNIKEPEIRSYEEDEGAVRSYNFGFVNQRPALYKAGTLVKNSESSYSVIVEYSNNIRFVHTKLVVPEKRAPKTTMKKQQTRIIALLPIEKYDIRREGRDWVLKQAK